VDHLAGEAILAGLEQHDYISSFCSFKQIIILLGAKKLMSSLKKAFEQYVGNRKATLFFHKKHKIHKDDCKKVWWDRIESVLKKFPRIFQVYG
jgi:hypothetical protein